MAGRHPNPGDHQFRRGGTQQGDINLSRVHIGQIIGTDVNSGIMTVQLLDINRRDKIVVPLQGYSAQGPRSSWVRYMPQDRDLALIAFGPNSTPYCLGYVAWGDLRDEQGSRNAGRGTFSPRLNGYKSFTNIAQRDNPPSGVGEFSVLNKGEWDMRSSGGAYIKGDRNGVLSLNGGHATLTLDFLRYESRFNAGMIDIAEGGTRLKIGDIKRKLPTDALDSPVTPGGKEYNLRVAYEPSFGVVSTYYAAIMGDLRDELNPSVRRSGIVEGAVMRVDQTVYGGEPVPSDGIIFRDYTLNIDSFGNVYEGQFGFATERNQEGETVTWSTSYLAQSHEATATLDMTGATVNINAGGAATDVLVRGNALLSYLSTAFVNTALGPSSPLQPSASLQANILSSNAGIT